MSLEKEADICLICEGSYPYRMGGVAQWVNELIYEHREKTFHILTLVPPNPDLTMYYKFPQNVISHTRIIVEDLPKGASSFLMPEKIWEVMGFTFKGLISSKEFCDFDQILKFFEQNRDVLGKHILCESKQFWDFILSLYDQVLPFGPFKSYFSTIYTLSRSIYSVLLPKLPKAKLFHAVCTGYAGLVLYRAKKELKVPCILTEHGIYSNERRIDIALAKWIVEKEAVDLDLEDKKRTLKDMWLNAFFSFAYACYTHADEVICTFDGNQAIQIEGGADPAKVQTIVHGINQEKYAAIKAKRTKHLPTVAFVGRVVPIKDVKTFIRACQIIHKKNPEIRFYILGSLEEDPEYAQECKNLCNFLEISKYIQFLGSVDLQKYFIEIDLVVLTSISEAQPLVMLEAGAVGIPCVATNVGACDQLINGSKDESPSLGQGGLVTPLVNPEATAAAILRIMGDADFYKTCSETIEKRIHTFYKFDQEHAKYRDLYNKHMNHG